MKIFIFKNLLTSTAKPKLVNYHTAKGITFPIVLILLFVFAQIGFSQIDCGGVVDNSCLNNSGVVYQCIDGDVDSHSQYGTTLLNPTDALTTPQFLLIKGMVLFTADYKFAPGSEIIFLDNDSGFKVNPFVKLTLESSFLHGCTALWKGIEVLDNATISANNCTFEDAKAAIILRRASIIGAVQNVFSKNVCGILASSGFGINLSIPIYLLGAKGIAGNTFNGDELLLESINPASIDPGISSVGNNSTIRPYVGIWLRGVISLTIGHTGESSAGGLNTFQNYGSAEGCPTLSTQYMGIHSDRSSIEVRNAAFLNIGHYDPVNSGENCLAVGIYAINTETVIPQTKIIGTNTFSNCIQDILTLGTSLEVKNMTSYKSWTSINFGMQNDSQNAIDVSIVDNDITFFRNTGIRGKWLRPIFIKIKDNLISDNNELYDPLARTGIFLNGRGWATKGGFGVLNNTIRSNSILSGGGFRGIILDNTPSIFVARNTIEEVMNTSSNLASFIGIRNLTFPSNRMTLATNTINGALINYPLSSAGIWLNECSNTRLLCNATDNINTGIVFFWRL